jgi:hypothetical protein
MSAYIMTKHEILAIASFVTKKQGKIHYFEHFNIARELLKINTQSVNARYNEKIRYNNVKFYDWMINPFDFDAIAPAQRTKLIDCYLYQCSELKNYDKQAIIQELQQLRDSLSFTESDYDLATWGLDESNTPKKPREPYQAIYNRIHGFSDSHVTR